ncbi:hypothetical protein MUP29_07190, partial [bacterium]|nr:hypothetical protein [bacterium]
MKTRSSGTLLTTILFLSACLLLFLTPVAAFAEGFQITPFMGYRIGGDFEDGATGTELSLSEEETYGIILNKETAPGFQSEFFYSFQPSRLTAGG